MQQVSTCCSKNEGQNLATLRKLSFLHDQMLEVRSYHHETDGKHNWTDKILLSATGER